MENVEIFETCWTCQGSGYLERKKGKSLCWACNGSGKVPKKENQFAKIRASWLKCVSSIHDQLQNSVREGEYKTIFLTQKELFLLNKIVKDYKSRFFDLTDMSEDLRKLTNRYGKMKKMSKIKKCREL